MKMSTADRPIERISANQERSFTIKATGKAFRILSSGLYKEKILAIVRELSCNAYDAHVDAGKSDLPFDVHLPNSLEAFFSVRDYGKGLSQEAMETIYTTYFESTKTESNEQIGGLGLGCKSPLAYVDQFTVISRHANIRSTYSIFFDENDTPSISLMSQEDSIEPTGLEVVIPVRSASFYEFRTKAEQVYSFFSPCPNVTGSAEFKVVKRTPILEGNGFKAYYGSYGESKAIMGVVAYPLDRYSVPELQNIPNASDLIYSGIHIEFAVGDLDITAGREELSYDQRTKTNIATRVKEIIEAIPDLVLEHVSKMTTEMEVRRYFDKINPIIGCLPNKQVLWQGKIINSSSFRIKMEDFDKIDITVFKKYNTRNGNVKVSIDQKYSANVSDTLTIQSNRDIVLITDDIGGRTMNRVRRFHEQTQSNRELYFMTVAGDAKQINDLKDMLEGAHFDVMSNLPKPIAVRGAGRAAVSVKRWDGADWNSSEVDEESFFVRMSGAYIIGPDGQEYDRLTFKNLINIVKNLGLITSGDVIYGIPKTVQKTMDAELNNTDSDWVDLIQYIFDHAHSIKDKVAVDITKAKTWNDFSRIHLEASILEKVKSNFSEDHAINVFHKNMITAKNDATQTFDTIQRLFSFANITITSGDTPHDLNAEWKAILNTYPMMRYLMDAKSWYYNDIDMIVELKNYIEMMDSKVVQKIDLSY